MANMADPFLGLLLLFYCYYFCIIVILLFTIIFTIDFQLINLKKKEVFNWDYSANYGMTSMIFVWYTTKVVPYKIICWKNQLKQ